jgi:hypothetical protein
MTKIPVLADLVGEVILESLSGPRDPLRQIGDAERIAGELSHLGGSLVGFFVEQARSEGLSWADIGAPRGLSRQGAQQRYAPLLSQLTLADLIEAGVLRQFGDSALAALRRAESHAARRGHDAIDSGDMLLGLLDDDLSLAVAAIKALDADPVVLRAELERLDDAGRAVPPASAADSSPRSGGPVPGAGESSDPGWPGLVSLGLEARRALDGAVAEARGHHVGPGHLLLGLLRNPAGRAGQALGGFGITRPTALASVLAVANRQSTEGM